MVKILILTFFSVVSLSVLAYERIVSTSGNASEALVALGLADKLIGVDITSTEPADIMADIPKIGYRRKLSSEGILSLNPDFLILAPDAGPDVVVRQIETAGIKTVMIADEQTLEGIQKDIVMLAEALSVSPDALLAEIKQDEQALQQTLASYQKKPSLLMLMDMSGHQLVALGAGTAGEHIAQILGASSTVAIEGMKPISKEVLATLDVDIILLAKQADETHPHTIDFLKDDSALAINMSAAAARNCVFRVDAMRTLGFGPFTARHANDIAKFLLPCINSQ